MAFNDERPAAQDLFDKYRDMFSNIVLGGAGVVPESNEWYAVAMNYHMAEDFYAIASKARDELDWRTACQTNLLDMADRDGYQPMPATYAQGYVKLTGTAGATLPAPLSFTIGGVTFDTADAAHQPTALNADGEAAIRVVATEAGTVGNITETEASLSTSVDNVNATAEVCGGQTCGGAEAEEIEAFRARYGRRLKLHPRSDNEWMVDKLLEWPCATRAIARAGSCCRCDSSVTGCGCEDCGGCLSYYVMFDNTFANGVADENTLQEVEDWMFGSPQGYGMGEAQIGVCGRIVPVQCVPLDVVIDIANCPTDTDVTRIEQQVAEYFLTVEPSQPMYLRAVDVVVSNIIGAETNYDVSATLTNAEQGFGDVYGTRDDDSVVYVNNRVFEPDCDYVICVNSVTVTRNNTLGTC